jgi:hypothetical protein
VGKQGAVTEDENERRIIRLHADVARELARVHDGIHCDIKNEFRDADLILRALSGDETVRFRAILLAARRLGAHATRVLMLSVAETGMSRLRIVMRPRMPSEFSDGGARDRKFDRKWRIERIGQRVYCLMKEGMTKAAAVKSAKEELRLNLSNRSIERELDAFRQIVRKRGYVGDPLMGALGGLAPRLRLSDLPKRGRPKNTPMPVRRLDVFPPPNRR